MKQFAELLTLRFESPATRHSYYRQLGLLQKFAACDPAVITEGQFRDYILFVKTKKLWKPKTIRQGAAAARLFFILQGGRKMGRRGGMMKSHPFQSLLLTHLLSPC